MRLSMRTDAQCGRADRSPLAAPLPARRCVQPRRAQGPLRCRATATAEAPASKSRPGEKKGFVEEMRFVAMRLHTRDQAPKEGEQKAAENPWQKWAPTREGYLQFLVESREVYQTLESIVESAAHADYARFRDTGLERAAPLAKDIAWMEGTYGLQARPVADDGPGRAYARLLQETSKQNPPALLCHFYNIYFAHSAGGRMIGTKVAQMILDGRQLAFYEYDGDMKEKLNGVRDTLNSVAESWSREEKDKCLEETTESFKYSGGLLRVIAEPPSGH